MNASELYRRLSEPFPSADVEWRITKVHQRSGLAPGSGQVIIAQ